MRAVQVVSLDGPDALVVNDVPEPSDPSMVVVEVHYAGVSFPDLLLSRGEYQLKPPPPFSPGAEVSGLVVSAPEGSGLTPGQRVGAVSGWGGWAEQAPFPVQTVVPLPDEISLEQGAGSMFNPMTVHFGLTRRGRLKPGETLLVHGAAGGIGVATLAVGKALGARTIAVVSTPEKVEIAQAAGADEVVLVDGWLKAVKELTGGRGVDVLLDPVGGDRFTDSVRALAVEGRLLVVGFTGREIPTVAVNRLLLNNVEVVGVGWGAFLASHPDYFHEQWADLAPRYADGSIPLVTGESFAMEDAGEALKRLDTRTATGRITLRVR